MSLSTPPVLSLLLIACCLLTVARISSLVSPIWRSRLDIDDVPAQLTKSGRHHPAVFHGRGGADGALVGRRPIANQDTPQCELDAKHLIQRLANDIGVVALLHLLSEQVAPEPQNKHTRFHT